MLLRNLFMACISLALLSSCARKDIVENNSPVYSLEFEMAEEESGTVYHIESMKNGRFQEIETVNYDPSAGGKYHADLHVITGELIRIRAVSKGNSESFSTIVQTK